MIQYWDPNLLNAFVVHVRAKRSHAGPTIHEISVNGKPLAESVHESITVTLYHLVFGLRRVVDDFRLHCIVVFREPFHLLEFLERN